MLPSRCGHRHAKPLGVFDGWLQPWALLATGQVGVLALKLQPHSNSLGLIARELALDIASSALNPDEAVHIPGLANKAADQLSRLCEPSSSGALPSYLIPHQEHLCGIRDKKWWRSLPRLTWDYYYDSHHNLFIKGVILGRRGFPWGG